MGKKWFILVITLITIAILLNVFQIRNEWLPDENGNLYCQFYSYGKPIGMGRG